LSSKNRELFQRFDEKGDRSPEYKNNHRLKLRQLEKEKKRNSKLLIVIRRSLYETKVMITIRENHKTLSKE